MTLVCNRCGNDQEFISERWYLHWVDIDADGVVTAVDPRHQGDLTSGIEPSDNGHRECANCNSSDIMEDYS